jgi:hypothetical protein
MLTLFPSNISILRVHDIRTRINLRERTTKKKTSKDTDGWLKNTADKSKVLCHRKNH